MTGNTRARVTHHNQEISTLIVNAHRGTNEVYNHNAAKDYTAVGGESVSHDAAGASSASLEIA